MMEKDRGARLENQRRLRALVRRHGADVTVFSGHDPHEFERLAGRPLGEPAEPTVQREAWPPRETARLHTEARRY